MKPRNPTSKMDQKRNDTNANTTTRTSTPIVAFDFPCSYLGHPRPIQSSRSSSRLLGTLKPPIREHLQGNSSNNSIDAQQTPSHSNGAYSLLSCPRQTVDGISSETILESEKGVASLKSDTNNHPVDIRDRDINALAVEIWFTPLLQEAINDETEIPLLPILSIAEPLVSMGESQGTTNTDPCERTQLMIGQRGEFLELVYRDHYEYLPDSFLEFDDDFFQHQNEVPSPQYSCRILRLTQWKLGEESGDRDDEETPEAVQGLHHIIVAWKKSGSVLQVFGNGKSIVSIDLLSGDDDIEVNNDSDFMRQWDPTYRLQVFSKSSHWSNASESTITSFNDVNDDNLLFSGAIHGVALFQQVLDEEAIKVMYDTGVEKRSDPFHTFFEDPQNPFEPLFLEATPIFATLDENKSDDDVSIRGVAVTQGNSTIISVGAEKTSNLTTALWDVLVEILELPKYGELIYNKTKESSEGPKNYATAHVGDNFLLEEGELRTNLEYRHLELDYFSVPKHSYNGTVLPMSKLPTESFSYRLIAVKKTGEETNLDVPDPSSVLLGSSEAIRQQVTIVHKNHPPVLVGLPNEVVQPEWQPSGIGSRPWAMLGANIVLNDEKDHDIDRVRLDVWAERGTLTIDLDDSDIRACAEITDCSNPMPTGLGGEWICSGKNDRNLTLFATPTDISRILSNLKYNAFNWGTSDSIVLLIHDGSGGLCPGKSTNIHAVDIEECFSITAMVEVPPMSRTEGGPSTGSIWKEHRAWWISLVVFLAILSMTCCCAIACWRRLRRIKKLNDIAVSDVERSPVVLASPEQGFPSSLPITEEDRRRAAISLNQRNRKKDEFAV